MNFITIEREEPDRSHREEYYNSENETEKVRKKEDDREKNFTTFAKNILKVNEIVSHPKEKKEETSSDESSETDSIDSESARMMEALLKKKKRAKEEKASGKKRMSERVSSSSEEEEKEDDNKNSSKRAKKKEGTALYEEQPVEASTKRGEEELEELFALDSVRTFQKKLAEDVAKILKKDLLDEAASKVQNVRPTEKPKKKMPAKKKSPKKKSAPKKKKSTSKSSKGNSIKVSKSFLKKLQNLSKKK